MHVVVLGAGGLGCVIGARLAEVGADVTLIARPAHVEAIERDGLQIGGIRGDTRRARRRRSGLRALTDAKEIDEPVDYLILLTKTRDTATALASADGLREQVGTALSLQNSVTKDDLLVDWIGDRAIGATTTEAGTIVGPGAVRHNATAPTSFYFGELDGTVSPRVTALAELFSSAGMGAQATPDIRQAEWEKLLQISIVSGFAASTLGYREPGAFAYGIAVRPGRRALRRDGQGAHRGLLRDGLRAARLLRAVLAVPAARGELVRRGRRRHARARHEHGRERDPRSAVAARRHRARTPHRGRRQPRRLPRRSRPAGDRGADRTRCVPSHQDPGGARNGQEA